MTRDDQTDLRVLTAMRTIDRLAAALNSNDDAAMNACFTRRSLAEMPFNPPRHRGSLGVNIDEIQTTDTMVIASITLDCPGAHPPSISMPFVLVQESGEWKIDMLATTRQMMAPARRKDLIEKAAAHLPTAADEISAMFDVKDDEADGQDGDDEDEQAAPEPVDDSKLQQELLESAIPSIKQVIPAWEQSLQMVAGHAVNVELDFESLEGRHEYLMSLIHGLGALMSAFTTACLDPSLQPFARQIIAIHYARSPLRLLEVEISAGVIRAVGPCDKDGNHPSSEQFSAALGNAFG